MAALLLVAALFVRADMAVPARDGHVLYLVSATTATRSEPDARAREMSKLKSFDVVSGREAAPGWLQIDLTTGAAGSGEWIPLDTDNVVSGTMEALKYRVGRAQQTRWPQGVRLDVARGRIRYGFSAEQVRLALGDPRSSKALRHTPNDVAEEWTYTELRVVVSTRGVTAIEAIPLR